MEPVPFPFATLVDLRTRWPLTPDGQDDHLEVLLEDASQYILDVCPTAADATPETRRRVVCQVVRRAVQAEQEADTGGLADMNVSAGPFNQQFTPTNPHGDMYLTRQERIALGHGKQVAFTIPMFGW